MRSDVVSGISSGFPLLSRCLGQVAHVLLTRSPLIPTRRWFTARLACVKHTASVRPEPGSNSPSNVIWQPSHVAGGTDFVERCRSTGTNEPGNTDARGHLSYQRNFPPWSAHASHDGGFGIDLHGTLLSSQGSGAHLGCRLRLPWGRSTRLPDFRTRNNSGDLQFCRLAASRSTAPVDPARCFRREEKRYAPGADTSTPATVRRPRRSTSHRPCSSGRLVTSTSASATRSLLA